MSQDPAVTVVEIEAVLADGTTVRASAAPGEDFALGEIPDTSRLYFELTGKTAEGETVARGRSVSFGIGSGYLPLFIQRLGAFARPPGQLARAHVHAPGGFIENRFLVAIGGDSAHGEEGSANPALGDFYDLQGLGGIEQEPFPRAARSMIARTSSLVLVDDAGASVVDSSGTTTDLDPPEGLAAFADVSGGLTRDSIDGTSFIVGATRSDGDPTAAILTLDTEGTLAATKLQHARRGAGIVYVEDVGMVIVGGSATGAGIEIIDDDAETVRTLPFPPDATEGAAAVIWDAKTIAVFGGRDGDAPAPTRLFDLGCLAAECAAVEREDLAIEAIASRGQAYALPKGLLVMGEAEPEGDGPGETLAFLVDRTTETLSVKPLPMRERRRGATPIPAPNGTLAVLGGITPTGAPALSVELFFPE